MLTINADYWNSMMVQGAAKINSINLEKNCGEVKALKFGAEI